MRRVQLRDDMTMADWQRVRSMQRADPFGGIDPSTVPTDDLPADQWQWARGRQALGLAGGQTSPVRQVALAAPQAKPPVTQGPLTGRPGAAAMVAGAVNAVTSGPNQSAPINTKGFTGWISRGAGRDVRAEGKLRLKDMPIPLPVGASGLLEPPTGRAEVTVSVVKGRGIGLPGRIRIYTTPSGELDFDLPGPVKVGPFPILEKGTYVIGTRDTPKQRR